MPLARDQKIAPTAHYTAWVWRRLRLPYAERFTTVEGAALFWSFRLAGEWVVAVLPRVTSMTQYLAQRHFAIEHALEQLRPDRIVEIGAGLSRRGVTWALDRGVPFVEVDLPHMTAEKRAHIERNFSPAERARLDTTLHLLSNDVLSPAFGEFLRDELEGSARPVVIAEGLLGYFDEAERLRIATAVRGGLPRGGAFVCDLRSKEGTAVTSAFAKVLGGAIKLITRGRGLRTDFADHAAIRAMFADAGFASSEPIDLRIVPRAPKVPSPARVWIARA